MKTRSRILLGAGGFTIVEIMVVVIIIGVLAALIAPRLIGRVGKAKQSVAKQKIAVLSGVIERFRLDYGRYPQDLQELTDRSDDIPEEKWSPPEIKPKDLIDPWDRQFIYTYPGDNDIFDLYTLGADGAEGGDGDSADIISW